MWVTAAPSPWQQSLVVLMLSGTVVMAPGGTLNFSSRNAKIERCLNCYYVLFSGRTCASKREEEKNTGRKKAGWRLTLQCKTHIQSVCNEIKSIIRKNTFIKFIVIRPRGAWLNRWSVKEIESSFQRRWFWRKFDMYPSSSLQRYLITQDWWISCLSVEGWRVWSVMLRLCYLKLKASRDGETLAVTDSTWRLLH